MDFLRYLAPAFSLAAMNLGCGDDKSAAAAANRATSVLEAQQQSERLPAAKAEAKLEEAEVQAVPTPLAPETLKAVFRDDLSGIRQGKVSVDTQTVKGVDVTEAQRQYKGRRRSRAQIEVFDLVARTVAKDFGPPFPTDAEKSREGEPLEIDGHPAFWQYKRRGKAGQLQVWVANRFYVRAKTKRFEKDTTARLVTKAIDIAALESAP